MTEEYRPTSRYFAQTNGHLGFGTTRTSQQVLANLDKPW
jgi:hypothetical protein